MPDVVGYRAKWGVIAPSTNTVVEHDFNVLGPPGITYHAGRIFIAEPTLDSDESFESLIAQIREAIEVAIRDVMTCEPDHLVMGMSAETFWGGLEGNEAFERRVREQSGLEVTTGASACATGLRAHDIERIAVLTPYQPIADEQVREFFTDSGFEVVTHRGLKCASATAIAQVTEADLVEVLRELNQPDVEAIVQVGTNLSMVRLADEAERWLGKPVLAINAVTLWHALRTNGFDDQVRGFGTLLRSH